MGVTNTWCGLMRWYSQWWLRCSNGCDDLDDLLGELLATETEADVVAASRAVGSHELVPGLHCMGCDFQILRIDGYVWSADAQYIFFRNSYPTVEKLKARLLLRKGCC